MHSWTSTTHTTFAVRPSDNPPLALRLNLHCPSDHSDGEGRYDYRVSGDEVAGHARDDTDATCYK